MKITNSKELRNELLQVFSEVKSGALSPKSAVEMNNAAGKIIHTVKLELTYASLRKEVPSIPFLDGAKG